MLEEMRNQILERAKKYQEESKMILSPKKKPLQAPPGGKKDEPKLLMR